MKLSKLLIVFIIILISCEKFEYSHYQVNLENKYRDIQSKNLARFKNKTADTIVIAVIGDSQRFYDATGKVVSLINNIPGINFVVHTGDLTDFGTRKEYIWMHDKLSTLRYPYIAVVGNHDMIGNGDEIYRQMYGEYNFSFIYNGNKFIYLNTCSREADFNGKVPDLDWLDKELSDTCNYRNAIIISHVPHLNVDFDVELRVDYENILKRYKKVLLNITGHNHDFSISTSDDKKITYLNSYSTSKGRFILLKIWENNFIYEIKDGHSDDNNHDIS